MKKIKWFVAFLIVANLLLGVIGCKDPEIHIHTYSEAWTSDEENHWHAAKCEHTTEISGKEAHTFGGWTITKEATEEAEGSKERVCDVCKYKETAEIAQLKHKHVAGESWKNDDKNHWKECTGCKEKLESAEHEYEWTTKAATCTEEGCKTGVCKVCKKEITEKIDAKGHSYSETWTKDATLHWHAATCGHTEEISEKAAHNFGNWTVTIVPTETQEGRKEKNCTVCGYTDSVVLQPVPKGFRFVKGTTITGEESWTPESDVFVSGRKLTIPALLVSDHEVTRGEYIAVMGKDPSTASAYDKDGNKLTGEDVLNNPVNEVNWYNALVYCNKLSIKENLTPCYSINSSTNPDKWGAEPNGRNDTWDAATCNFEADGYRLPTEAEGEWLARGGENYIYAGSDNVDDVAWYRENTNITGTREVKTKAPNGYGLYDMSGSVLEWCWDWYVRDISDSTAADGASAGSCRVYRGGSWDLNSDGCAVSCRNYGPTHSRLDSLGLRVVRSAN